MVLVVNPAGSHYRLSDTRTPGHLSFHSVADFSLTGKFLLQVFKVLVAVLVHADQRSGFGITCIL